MLNTKWTDGSKTQTMREWIRECGGTGPFEVAVRNGYLEDVLDTPIEDGPPFM